MKGLLITITPEGMSSKEISSPDSEEFHKAVGGWLELVPYFDSIVLDGEIYQCVAFCDEEGKIKGKAINVPATILWKLAQERSGRDVEDHLVGNICLIIGDAELMRSL